MKAFDIPNTHQSIKKDFDEGRITLEEAALEWHRCGFTNFVDIRYAKKMLGLENECITSSNAAIN